MYKYQVKEFAQYEVYELVDGKRHTLCICKEFKAAKFIARMFATSDDSYSYYYVEGMYYPNQSVPGGKWRYCYHKSLLKRTVEEIEEIK